MVDHPDVDVATGDDELLAEFESIVERYDAVRSDLEAVKSERPTGEDDGFTGKVSSPRSRSSAGGTDTRSTSRRSRSCPRTTGPCSSRSTSKTRIPS